MKLSIVSYLDQQSSLYVRKLQQKLSDLTGSKASLNSWEPHVTIGDGVEANEDQIEQLKDRVTSLANHTHTFSLTLNGIGSLDNWKGGAGETPYVIYLDVVLNDELIKIVSEVELECAQYDKWYHMPRPYLPHCTLAFRDLSKDGYEKGLKYINNLNPTLTASIDHIALVEKLSDADRELTRFKFND